jgi:hypothetical protein
MAEIENYGGRYTITEEGIVISHLYNRERKLKPQKASQSSKGYFQVRLFSEEHKKGKLQYVHRLVWQTFKGEIPKGFEIDHIDGDTSNNKLENLQLLAPRDNKIKGFKGKDIYWREYRDEFIELYKKLGTYKKVAQHYGINTNVVFRVIKNVFHKKNFKTGRYESMRFNPELNDEFTRGDRRKNVIVDRQRTKKGQYA